MSGGEVVTPHACYNGYCDNFHADLEGGFSCDLSTAFGEAAIASYEIDIYGVQPTDFEESFGVDNLRFENGAILFDIVDVEGFYGGDGVIMFYVGSVKYTIGLI